MRIACSGLIVGFAFLACGGDGGNGHASNASDAGPSGNDAAAGGSGGSAPTGGTGGTLVSVVDGGSGSGGSGGSGDTGSRGSGGSGDAGSGGSGGGSGGSAALPDQAACTPATQTYASGYNDLDPIVAQCDTLGFEAALETRIPNPTGMDFSEEVPLTTPLAAGAAAALSVRLRSDSTRGTFEVWGGSGDACGPVDELLWWTEIESRRLCGQFTPTHAVSRLVFVWRRQEPLHASFDFGVNDVSICAAGSCPGDSSGHGRMPGAALSAPVGLYTEGGTNLPWALGIVLDLGQYGHVIARYLDNDQGQTTRPLTGGVVRMPPYDSFGDTWYCLDAQSTYSRVRALGSDDKSGLLELRGLTRLASCEGNAGAGTAQISVTSDPNTASGTAEVTASDTDFAMTGASMEGSCAHDTCAFQLAIDADATMVRVSELYVQADADLGSWSDPKLQDATVTSATWVYVPTSGPMKVACASGGTIHYDPKGQTTVALQSISAAASCPGDATDPNMLDVQLE